MLVDALLVVTRGYSIGRTDTMFITHVKGIFFFSIVPRLIPFVPKCDERVTLLVYKITAIATEIMKVADLIR